MLPNLLLAVAGSGAVVLALEIMTSRRRRRSEVLRQEKAALDRSLSRDRGGLGSGIRLPLSIAGGAASALALAPLNLISPSEEIEGAIVAPRPLPDNLKLVFMAGIAAFVIWMLISRS